MVKRMFPSLVADIRWRRQHLHIHAQLAGSNSSLLWYDMDGMREKTGLCTKSGFPCYELPSMPPFGMLSTPLGYSTSHLKSPLAPTPRWKAWRTIPKYPNIFWRIDEMWTEHKHVLCLLITHLSEKTISPVENQWRDNPFLHSAAFPFNTSKFLHEGLLCDWRDLRQSFI